MLLFVVLHKVVVTSEFVDKTLVCDHSNENCRPILSCGTVYSAAQGGPNF